MSEKERKQWTMFSSNNDDNNDDDDDDNNNDTTNNNKQLFLLTKKSPISITVAIPKGPVIRITPGNFQVPIYIWVVNGKC